MNPTLLWLIAGVILCLMELFLPTAFIELAMGISALLIAALSLVLPVFGLQVVLWMGISLALVFGVRRFLPQRKVRSVEAATEAETLTEILPGQAGRVLYEGNSWRARCSDQQIAIAPQQPVYVVGREGNTLIIVPQNLLNS